MMHAPVTPQDRGVIEQIGKRFELFFLRRNTEAVQAFSCLVHEAYSSELPQNMERHALLQIYSLLCQLRGVLTHEVLSDLRKAQEVLPALPLHERTAQVAFKSITLSKNGIQRSFSSVVLVLPENTVLRAFETR
jgi:hypothetical protein